MRHSSEFHRNGMKISVLFVVISCLFPIEGSKILFIALDHPADINWFTISGKALQTNGHDVVLLAPEHYQDYIEETGLRAFIYPSMAESERTSFQSLDDILTERFSMGFTLKSFLVDAYVLKTIKAKYTGVCTGLLNNLKIQKQIEKEKFDLAVVGVTEYFRCFILIPWLHGIQYVTFTDIPFPWAANVPAMPSVEPSRLLPISNQMNFFERIGNFMVNLIMVTQTTSAEENALTRNVSGNRKERNLEQVYSKAGMHFVIIDTFVLDYPRVSAPHYIYLRGMGGRPPKRLSVEIENFIEKRGVLAVISFGSNLKVPDFLLLQLLRVFEQIQGVNFIMRYQGANPMKTPSNVLLLKWLPQNDLLGHKRTRLFITHGGANGQIEALYHGVPMVVCPVWGDHLYNAKRIKERGYGKAISLSQIKDEEILAAVNEVLWNKSYYRNIQRASKIYHSLPPAEDAFVFWVNHILQFGSDHIRPPYVEMPYFSLFMVDAMALLLASCLLILLTCCYVPYRVLNSTVSKSVRKTKSD